MKKLIYVFLFFLLLIGLNFFRPKENYQNNLTQQHLEIRPQDILPIPNLDKIFSDDHDWTATLSAQKKIVMIATGDVIPARSVNWKVINYGDFTWPYLNTAETLKKADITLINLETPLIDNCPVTLEGMVFCSDSRNIEGLIYAGVDVANLANNHAGNYGENSVVSTKKLLHERRILTTGLTDAEIMTVNGIRFAFLGYNDISKPQPGISNVYEEKIYSDITNAKEKSDVIIVSFHWGEEYRSQPDSRQKYLAHLAIDAGADLIIGNHPHWIQPIEIYKDKLITYAHGNFVFDQEWSLKTKQGVIGMYTFYNNHLVDVEYLPLQIEDFGQPYFLTGEAKQNILSSMKIQSEDLNKNDQDFN